ncbi:MAG: energy-coupling factor ABC transporter permease [Caldimicrobium thiodismutans]
MHISEGILPLSWAGTWWAGTACILGLSFRNLKKDLENQQEKKAVFAFVTALVFLFSAVPIPVPFSGTCSHPVGIGISVLLLGLSGSIVSGFIVLLLQALFLAHGGLSTLGANAFSMAIMGSLAAFLVLKILQSFRISLYLKGFFMGLLADWITYLTTAFQLAIALKGEEGFYPLFLKVLLAFIPTQVPIGIIEGIITGALAYAIAKKRKDLLYIKVI